MGSVRGEAITVVSEDEQGIRIFALQTPTWTRHATLRDTSINYLIKYYKNTLLLHREVYDEILFVLRYNAIDNSNNLF